MTKKNTNKVLIIAVALIWGILIYKFISGNNQNIEQDLVSNQFNNQINFNTITKDTFEIKSYSRDPFLGKTFKQKYNSTGQVKLNNSKQSITKPKQVNNTTWPEIKYIGFVKEKTSKESRLLLYINNKFYRKKQSFVFDEGIEILKCYNDSILVKFNNEKKVFKK